MSEFLSFSNRFAKRAKTRAVQTRASVQDVDSSNNSRFLYERRYRNTRASIAPDSTAPLIDDLLVAKQTKFSNRKLLKTSKLSTDLAHTHDLYPLITHNSSNFTQETLVEKMNLSQILAKESLVQEIKCLMNEEKQFLSQQKWLEQYRVSLKTQSKEYNIEDQNEMSEKRNVVFQKQGMIQTVNRNRSGSHLSPSNESLDEQAIPQIILIDSLNQLSRNIVQPQNQLSETYRSKTPTDPKAGITPRSRKKEQKMQDYTRFQLKHQIIENIISEKKSPSQRRYIQANEPIVSPKFPYKSTSRRPQTEMKDFLDSEILSKKRRNYEKIVIQKEFEINQQNQAEMKTNREMFEVQKIPHQKQMSQFDLYFEVANQFNNDIGKHKFLTNLYIKMKDSFQEMAGILEKQANQIQFQQIETKNLQKNLQMTQNQLIGFKEKQAEYIAVINQAKDSEDSFHQRFNDAQEFLDSKNYIDHIQKEFKIQDLIALKIKEKFTGKKPTPEELNFGEQMAKNFENKMKELNFSGVTSELDQILEGLNNQASISQKCKKDLSQVNTEEEAFDLFAEKMKNRFSQLQLETARKLMLRLNKNQTFAEIGLQCGQEEINNSLLERMRAQSKEIDDLHIDNEALDTQIDDLKIQIVEANTRCSKLMKQLMDQTQKVQLLEIENGEQQLNIKRISENERQIKQSIVKMETSRAQMNKTADGRSTMSPLKVQNESPAITIINEGSSLEPMKEGLSPMKVPVMKKAKSKGKKGSVTTSIKKGKKDNSISPRKDDAKDSESQLEDPDIVDIADDINLRNAPKSPERKAIQSKLSGLMDNAISSESSFDDRVGGVVSKKSSKFGSPVDKFGSICRSPAENMSPKRSQKPGLIAIKSVPKGTSPLPEGTGTYEGSNSHRFSNDSGDRDNDYMSPQYLKAPNKNNSIKIKKTPGSKLSREFQSTQTCPELFFEYILDLLRTLDQKINSGEILAEHLLNPDQELSVLEQELLKSREKLKELSQILGRIGSLRNGGGDVFFKGLAKIFQTNPIIPAALQSKLDALGQKKKKQILGYPKHILDFRIKK